MKEYYSLRRLNPYMGLLQVIDMGGVRAYSDDGSNWRVRRVYDKESHWSIYDPNDKVSRRELQQAIEQHPPLPFPLAAHHELWLLERESLLPLALMRSCRWESEVDEVRDPHWQGFSQRHSGFHVDALATGGDHQRLLEQMIEDAARPQPVVQWFLRDEQGNGIGLGGLRVNADMEGRRLPAESFPPLLIREQWDTEQRCLLAQGFHAWYAAKLLVHTDLSDALRLRLEQSLMHNPLPLLQSYSLLPRVLDKKSVDIALVAARLMKTTRVK